MTSYQHFFLSLQSTNFSVKSLILSWNLTPWLNTSVWNKSGKIIGPVKWFVSPIIEICYKCCKSYQPRPFIFSLRPTVWQVFRTLLNASADKMPVNVMFKSEETMLNLREVCLLCECRFRMSKAIVYHCLTHRVPSVLWARHSSPSSSCKLQTATMDPWTPLLPKLENCQHCRQPPLRSHLGKSSLWRHGTQSLYSPTVYKLVRSWDKKPQNEWGEGRGVPLHEAFHWWGMADSRGQAAMRWVWWPGGWQPRWQRSRWAWRTPEN